MSKRDGQPAKRTRRRPEEARQLILDAAKAILIERGPNALGLKDVALAAGVSHALVSHYFGTVHNLIDAAFADHFGGIRQSLSAADEQANVVETFFEALAAPAHSRAFAWSLLTDRVRSDNIFDGDQGFSDLIAGVRASLPDAADELPDEQVEFAITLAMTSAFGYALARDFLWSEEHGPDNPHPRDGWFREALAKTVEELLAQRS